MALIQSTAIPSGATAYEIEQSLRFNDDDSAYLSWTPASAGNRKTWTWSGWVKRGNLGVGGVIFGAVGDNSRMRFSTDKIQWEFNNTQTWRLVTTQKFRDPSAWFHLLINVDTTQGTAANRMSMYINGVKVTAFDNEDYPTLNGEGGTNNNSLQSIGRDATNSDNYLDGYLAEVNFIDGQALTPADFGETGDYGEWKPIEYSGSYGTNGFYLDFSNSGALGTDSSGNSNTWTVNNLVATDQMLDSPTNNFATWNPLFMDGVNTGDSNNTLVLKEGNLRQDFDNTSTVSPTLNISSGKGYFEVYWKNNSTYGIQAGYINDEYTGSSTGRHRFYYRTTSGEIYRYSDSSNTSVSATYGAGDIIQFAWDMDSGKCWIGRNNTWYDSSIGTTGNPSTGANPVFTLTSSQLEGLIPHIKAEHGTSEIIANFGQDSSFAGNKTAQGNQDGNGIGDFYYEPPTGFLALCTSNLPAVAVVPSEHFNTVLYTGNTSTQSITGVGFEPDFVWIKSRGATEPHNAFDQVRGEQKRLLPNQTNAEGTISTALTSFDTDGFTLGGHDHTNNSTYSPYVAWNWKANGSGSSNTNGDITSTVSANVDAGFSIVSATYSGSGTKTFGHGLSSAPELIIGKNRSAVANWGIYNSTIGAGKYLLLDTTGAEVASTTIWSNTAPTSTVFSSDVGWLADAGNDVIFYCFHSVEGYSKIGSYTGNGKADGTFAYTGFRPAYVMIKCSSSSTHAHWFIFDSVRQTYNVIGDVALAANLANTEGLGGTWDPNTSGAVIDFLSNGFKIRTTSTHGISASGATHTYLAFAETPFKYSNAR